MPQRYPYLILLMLLLLMNGFIAGSNMKYLNVKNFSKNSYLAANQNWSVNASTNGYMYFANHKGLLEFDGAIWKLMPLPHETILRAVYVDSDSLIYTAGYREMGYWKKNLDGKLKYVSLNNLAGSLFSKNEEFWNIAKLKDRVYFQSFSKILMYSGSEVTSVVFDGFVNTMKRVDDKIYVAVRDRGIYVLSDSIPEPLITDEAVRRSLVRFIVPYRESKLLIGTSTNGIFVWDGTSLSVWNPAWTDYFRKNEVNRAHINNQGEIIIGTITDGIVIFDREGRLLSKFNTGNGMQNNTVLGIASDIFNNIWIALDNGIDFISKDTHFLFQKEYIQDIGSVYDLSYFEGKLYLGTNQGLFVRDSGSVFLDFRLIPEVQGQVWFCQKIHDQLLVGYNGGIVSIKNQVVNLVSPHSGGFCIQEDPFDPDHYVISTYNNLVRVFRQGSVYRETGIIHGFSDLIRYIEFDHRGNIWASHMHRGIYKLHLNERRDSVITTTYYGENSSFRKDHFVHVFKVENRVVFTTGEQIFTYDDIGDTIVPYTSLNLSLQDFAKAHRIVPAPGNHYWFITREKLGLFLIRNNQVEMINYIPRSLFTPNALIDDFENIRPLDSRKAILCLENGIAGIFLEKTSETEISQYKPILKQIKLTDPRGHSEEGIIDDGSADVKYKYRNITLSYTFPHYSHYPVNYRYFLKGIDYDWSESQKEPVFSFDRLPEGSYELLVKAVDPWGNESQPFGITINIQPPWYLSSLARNGYVIILIAVFLGLQAYAIKRTRRRERIQLEKRERELFKLKNEKLNDEVEHKSKELANLTMAIVKKNEFLLDLKQSLSDHKEQLGNRYPDKYFNTVIRKIDENMDDTDDWNLFETNFERAHEQFLDKMKELYPELTPRDLRLCAFLRMNLSSKEIAPLLGISVRGVENHRYRLRKKIGLEHDDSLISLIIKL